MSDFRMEPKSIFGVIDLKDGRAVHAIAGMRDQYRPVRCDLTRTGDPIELARGYQQMGAGGLYVADLDAIEGGRANDAWIDRLLALGSTVWLDAGFPWHDRTAEASNCWNVVGTESLSDMDQVAALAAAQRRQLVLSVDLCRGSLITKDGPLRACSPVDVAQKAWELGVRHLIVLELTKVGTASGPSTAPICSQIHERFPGLNIASGGGIRSRKDASLLEKAGCKRFLIGTALHDGRKNSLIGDVSC